MSEVIVPFSMTGGHLGDDDGVVIEVVVRHRYRVRVHGDMDAVEVANRAAAFLSGDAFISRGSEGSAYYVAQMPGEVVSAAPVSGPSVTDQ